MLNNVIVRTLFERHLSAAELLSLVMLVLLVQALGWKGALLSFPIMLAARMARDCIDPVPEALPEDPTHG